MIPALRWAPMRVMRAVFQVSLTVKSVFQVSLTVRAVFQVSLTVRAVFQVSLTVRAVFQVSLTVRAVFQVSLIVRNKVTWDCPQTTTFEERDQLKQNWTEVLCLPAKLAHWPARLVLQMTCLSNWKSAGTTYNWCLWWAQWFLRNPLYCLWKCIQ